jgi:hypothetical protein
MPIALFSASVKDGYRKGALDVSAYRRVNVIREALLTAGLRVAFDKTRPKVLDQFLVAGQRMAPLQRLGRGRYGLSTVPDGHGALPEPPGQRDRIGSPADDSGA